MSSSLISLSWDPKLPSASSSKLPKPQLEATTTALWKISKLLKEQIPDTAGSNWFDMPATTITPELKKDLQLLKLRNVIDPKRHYKKGDAKDSEFDFYSCRLTKKGREQSLAEELLSNKHLADYRKRKVREIEEKNRPHTVDKWKNKSKETWKRAEQRRH